jgi:hypothetical protein
MPRTLPPALKKWNDFVKEYRKKHPNLSFKDALKQAAKEYKNKKA